MPVMEDQGPSRRFIIMMIMRLGSGACEVLQIEKGGENQVGRRRDRACGRMSCGAMRDRSVLASR